MIGTRCHQSGASLPPNQLRCLPWIFISRAGFSFQHCLLRSPTFACIELSRYKGNFSVLCFDGVFRRSLRYSKSRRDYCCTLCSDYCYTLCRDYCYSSTLQLSSAPSKIVLFSSSLLKTAAPGSPRRVPCMIAEATTRLTRKTPHLAPVCCRRIRFDSPLAR